MSKPLIVLQARTGSTRLPQKMTRPFWEGKPVLELILDRITERLPDMRERVVVATTTSPGDDAIEELCRRKGIAFYRGSEADVLDRFVNTAAAYGADKLIRICADNVFLDTDALARLVDEVDADTDNDYISFCLSDGTPSIRTHYGFWAEGAKVDALKRVARDVDDMFYHEHVTNYLYSEGSGFKCRFLPVDKSIESHTRLRLTLDTQEDFDMQTAIYKDMAAMGKKLTPSNLMEYLDARPGYYDRMQAVIERNGK